MTCVIHPFAPVFDETSHILVLGTIPSPQSRKNGFYYSHPQNEFWHVLSALLHEKQPRTTEEKKAFLLKHHIAVWDVLHSCEIEGASDSRIRRPIPNDFSDLFAAAPIQQIFTTGKKATVLYQKLCEPRNRRAAAYLPSTSPANRYWFPYPKLLEAYQVLLPYLEE